ncbi:unnamed protein product [Microthlaspi erraticum]|uniref:F-box domain-containing protein n=1 Tax=Microthlaspi erraticum TaxID=1685480 RepID=A0A6D2JJ22_9BRAS|nr:unnamed protein product [Microthlaspi erraticum]
MSNERIDSHKQSQISSLPDEILQHILSFVSTKFAIRTSLLCSRWRHVWSNMPSLCFDNTTLKAASINKTLTFYTALKMMDFHLKTNSALNVPHIDKWIEFAMHCPGTWRICSLISVFFIIMIFQSSSTSIPLSSNST